MKSLRVLKRAYDIPEKSIVTKRTGEKEYLMVSEVRVFNPSPQVNTKVKAEIGHVFLLDPATGDMNSVRHNTELLWCCEPEDLIE